MSTETLVLQALNEAVATACTLPSCHREFHPGPQRGAPRRYCSSVCRSKHWDETHPRVQVEQAKLNFAIPVRDPRSSPADRSRLTGHNAEILDRLRLGPATNAELAALRPNANAWRTRVSDVRLWLERNESKTIKPTRITGGLWRYEIVAK